jgi:argininosuccinate lyase
LPFRDAHHVVGSLVRIAEGRGVELSELGTEELFAVHPKLLELDLGSVLDPRRAVERRALVGGPAKERVVAEIALARARWAAR